MYFVQYILGENRERGKNEKDIICKIYQMFSIDWKKKLVLKWQLLSTLFPQYVFWSEV